MTAQTETKKVVEITVRHVSDLSESTKNEVIGQAATMGDNFSGYARVFYVEASPKTIIKVEPIMGNPLEEFTE